MKKLYFILSQSGGGKDTHSKKLLDYLKSKGIKHLYMSMGDEIRGTIEKLGPNNFFSQHMRSINDLGKFQPAVVPMYFLIKFIMEHYTDDEVIIVNGSPRSKKELKLWASLIQTGYLPEACILNLEVTDEECRRRMKARAEIEDRFDTTNESSRERKLRQYKPVRAFLKKPLPKGITKIDIDGMRSKEEVFKDVVKALERDITRV